MGAHPDDIELACGGTLAKLTQLGYRVGVLDLTRGEAATRGTPEIRAREAEEAARVLGLSVRRNLGLADAHVVDDLPARAAMVRVLRELRPTLVIAPHQADYHPDHARCGQLVKDALYVAGLRQVEPALPPHRPRALVHYPSHEEVVPSFVVDISAQHEAKMRAVRCYRSQFHDPGSTEPETLISSRQFLDRIEVRARYWGERIGATHGEPFRFEGVVPLATPLGVLSPREPPS